ncbi:hypothetical protein COLO4_01717 [Corchorus olitorius]|uniref:Uncharacterized protein n=1 Tax=Corchorus olitorius TaxID=93759 RepID=A0A1R3L2C0_9ROSI|nr:hypothetical protein COLO4_01717 [Corchorus olitorius]
MAMKGMFDLHCHNIFTHTHFTDNISDHIQIKFIGRHFIAFQRNSSIPNIWIGCTMHMSNIIAIRSRTKVTSIPRHHFVITNPALFIKSLIITARLLLKRIIDMRNGMSMSCYSDGPWQGRTIPVDNEVACGADVGSAIPFKATEIASK